MDITDYIEPMLIDTIMEGVEVDDEEFHNFIRYETKVNIHHHFYNFLRGSMDFIEQDEAERLDVNPEEDGICVAHFLDAFVMATRGIIASDHKAINERWEESKKSKMKNGRMVH